MFKIKSIFNNHNIASNINNIKPKMSNQIYNNDIFSSNASNSYSSNSIINKILRSDSKMVRIFTINKDKHWSIISYEKYLSNKYLYMYDYGKLCYNKSILKNNQKNNQKNLKTIEKKEWITEEQSKELFSLEISISKMLQHFSIFEEKDKYLNFVTKTTKDKKFNYYFKETYVIKITDKSYMSNVIYKSLLSEKESLELNTIFKSYKGNTKEMWRYGCDINDTEIFNRQITIFKNITKTVDISKLIKVKYSIINNINNIYIMVNENYINKEIEVDQWEDFLEFYKIKLKELDLPSECDLSINKSEL
jgi:hypothetical protein